MMNDYGCGKGGLDNSGFHYDDCAGGPCGCDERRYGSWSGRRGGGSCTGAYGCGKGGLDNSGYKEIRPIYGNK
ncbi:unknown [Roseburia sp. CAG:50]|nr:unknown [Roseburia sp. CAG:50]